MGITLIDKKSEEIVFQINFWNWRPIVEEIKKLNIISFEKANSLHEQFCGSGLNIEECKNVSNALIEMTIPMISEDERLLLDGKKTEESDDLVFHKDDVEKNYSTNRSVLLAFSKAIEKCNGFEVC